VDLERFEIAQEKVYDCALQEIQNGEKQGHWMWFIFPQYKGLGYSEAAKYYAIQSIAEAANYLQHHILGKRLIEISNVLTSLITSDATEVFGVVDSLKLRSSMTLFNAVATNEVYVFQKVLDKFFAGRADKNTLELIEQEEE
jgi:uncharacterized protein (DUF1810 family)